MKLGKNMCTPTKKGKKYDSHTFLYIKKYFFPCLPRLHKREYI